MDLMQESYSSRSRGDKEEPGRPGVDGKSQERQRSHQGPSELPLPNLPPKSKSLMTPL